ncbi:MAG: hypothetical protein WA832_19650 [Bradyrhizobium sp.]|uniref:hypothetical protein n=1 Tax=Bradyrhizobium sp. TaxID=376 RepID=UPI003C7A960C
MRITVRGWGRDLGETEIMNASLDEAVAPEGSYSRGKVYKKVQNPESRRRTSLRISTGTEVRLGGTYLMHVDLSRKEIAQLFFETHNGSMVRMFKAFIEEEDAEDRAEMLQKLAQMDERRRQRMIDVKSEVAP